ncbi:MAG: hypothetical protein M5R36_00870 [Deltaproteobacteria bacterium]|nr:hypothetical protein [Deltaproteobacteria bacterium]
MKQGGVVMIPLVAGTLVLWYALGYRFATLRRGNPRSVRVLVERYRAGREGAPRGMVDGAVAKGVEIMRSAPQPARRFLDEGFDGFERDAARTRRWCAASSPPRRSRACSARFPA